jgi:transcription initiation factor IIE alpha subunit
MEEASELKETASPKRIDATAEAFRGERLRWLIGKGDILVQRGELSEKRLKQLMEITVKEETDRSEILNHLTNSPATVTELAKATKMEKSYILENLFALMKWNFVEITGSDSREYVYRKKQV